VQCSRTATVGPVEASYEHAFGIGRGAGVARARSACIAGWYARRRARLFRFREGARSVVGPALSTIRTTAVVVAHNQPVALSVADQVVIDEMLEALRHR
jgi:hypothetical protein